MDACTPALKSQILAGTVRLAGQVKTVITGDVPRVRFIPDGFPVADQNMTGLEAGTPGAHVSVIGNLGSTVVTKLIAGLDGALVTRMVTGDVLTMNIRQLPIPDHVTDRPPSGEHPTTTGFHPTNSLQPAPSS